MIKWSATLMLCLLGQVFLLGQSATQHSFLIESVVDLGIMSPEITALYQDKAGYIWVGNKPGISRFNGDHFNNFTHTPEEAIGTVYCIVEDQPGRLWIGGQNGLFYFTNDAFRKVHLELEGVIRNLLIDQKGRLWVSGLGFIPFYVLEEDLQNIQHNTKPEVESIFPPNHWPADIGPMRIWDMDEDDNGNIWFGLDNAVVRFDHESVQVVWQEPTSIYKYSMIEAFHKDSVFWGSESSELMFKGKDNKISKLSDAVCYMSDAKDTATYYLTSQMLVKLQHGVLDTLHVLDKYSNLYLQHLLVDREGNFWIGAVGDLLRLTPKIINTISYPEEPLLGACFSLEELENGNLRIGGRAGKTIDIIGDKLVEGPTLDLAHNSLIYDIHRDKINRIWYASSMNGLVVEQDGKYKNYSVDNGLADNTQLFFYESLNGELWSGGDGGITKINETPESVLQFQFFAAQYLEEDIPEFRNIFKSPDLTIWAVGDKGLFKVENGNLIRTVLKDGMVDYPIVTNAFVDKKNQLWIFTQGNGIYQCEFNEDMNPTLKKQWTIGDGLMSNTILGSHLDTLDRIWIAHSMGVCTILNDEYSTVSCLDKEDGWNFSSSPFFNFLETEDHDLYIVGNTGFSKMSINQNSINTVKPNTFIDKVELFDDGKNNQKIIRRADSGVNNTSELKLAHDNNYLRFYFSTTSQTKSSKNSFKYRLLGLDNSWYPAKGSKNILYPALAPGNYTFEVTASNNDGIWSEEPAHFDFEISAPWYKSWWAFILYLISLAISIYVFLNYRQDRMAEKQEAVRLQELDAFKSRFYSNITHEFRTPLTVINGMVDELNGANQVDAKKLSLIKSNSSQLLKLVNELLDISKFKADKSNISFIQSDLVSYLKFRVGSLESLANLRNIDLRFISENDEIIMDFDSNLIDQLINNLLSNALKFTSEYGHVDVACKRINNSQSDHIEIQVQDSGVGISNDQLPFIFDRFVQFLPSDMQQGSGIGLSLVNEIVDTLNGTIKVESEEGKGSNFIVNLPIQNKAPIQKLVPKKSKNAEFYSKLSDSLPGDEKPILFIIEDNEDIRFYLEQILIDIFTIHSFPNGIEALQNVEDIIPDIIITDVMMPHMDGFEFCQRIKQNEKTNHIPMILLTAKATTQDKNIGLGYGADAYMIKPFNKEELIIRLTKLMETRALLQHKYSQKLMVLGDDKLVTPIDKFIIRVNNHVLDHLSDEDYNLNVLTEYLNLSRSQVHRKIKAVTGLSTANYIRNIRLQKAKQLLEKTDLNISEIAYQVGFKSPAYFSQAYKDRFDISPTESRF